MRTTTVYKKGLVFLCSVVLFLAFALGAWSVITAHTSAQAEEISAVAEGDERILYFVDAGYLVQGDTLAERGGWASIYDKPTPFMNLYGLEFGDGNGNGLYNSQTDKHLYELGGGDLYNLNNILTDPKTGKYWGTYVTDGKAYGWEWWRRGRTSSTKPGFESARYIHENSSDPGSLFYDFEVDDTTTELKVIIGTRRVSDGNQASTTNGSLKINNLAEQTGIRCDDTDRVYTYDTGITGVEKSMSGMEGTKPFVTVEIGGNGNITHVAYIIICTKNYQLPVAYTNSDTFIKKGTTSVKANASDGSATLDAQITEAGQKAINDATYFTEVEYDVEFDSDYGHKEYTWKATVLPANYDYFVNCGGSAIGNFAVADQTYVKSSLFGTHNDYGYKDEQYNGKNSSSAQYAGDAYYLSCRCDTTSITYQFDKLTSGKAYAVTVGVVEHWTQYMSPKIRTHTVTSNGESMTVACADSDNVMTYGTLYTVIDSTSLDVKIECPDESVISFILVYEAALVTFDTQGGGSIAPMGFEPGKLTEVYADEPIKADHEFIGWFSAADGGEEVTEVSESTTLYAHWVSCVYDWENAEWNWDGVISAGLNTRCTNCNKAKTANAVVTSEITTEPTCEEAGECTYTATVTVGDDTVTDAKTARVRALGHSYGTPTNNDWSEWDEENDAAYLSLYCERENCEHCALLEAEITSRHENGSCTEAGTYIFTATVEYEGNHYENEYEREGAPLGHLLAEPTEGDIDWYLEDGTATVHLYCEREGCDYSEEVEVELVRTTTATCLEEGEYYYTATVRVNGIDYSFDTESEHEDALGHKGVKIEAIGATCTEGGAVEHYECANCGKKYSDSGCTTEITDIATAPLGHDLVVTDLVWNWLGYGKASVTVKCVRCNENVSLTAEITENVIKEVTDTADGEIRYTATVTINGVSYSDVKTAVITKTGVATPVEEKGCNGSVAASSCIAAIMLLIAAAVILVKKQSAKISK